MKKVSILIATKDRLEELKITLSSIAPYLSEGTQLILCDDHSTDGTFEFIKQNYPEVRIIRNEINRGYIHSRNKMLSLVETPYAISLDDDANFLTKNPLKSVVDFFENQPACAVIAFRIYWGLSEPSKKGTEEKPMRVKGFVGCGHAWRMTAWKSIPSYPEWFEFYGEEVFSSYHLFKKKWQIWYDPQILVHHRVDNQKRRDNQDYQLRLRRSLRSGWFLYFLFLPILMIPEKLMYSIWMQFKLKILKGNGQALVGLWGAFRDIFRNLRQLKRSRDPLTREELRSYNSLPDTFIYWSPKETVSEDF